MLHSKFINSNKTREQGTFQRKPQRNKLNWTAFGVLRAFWFRLTCFFHSLCWREKIKIVKLLFSNQIRSTQQSTQIQPRKSFLRKMLVKKKRGIFYLVWSRIFFSLLASLLYSERSTVSFELCGNTFFIDQLQCV